MRQDGSRLLWCLCQSLTFYHLNRNRDNLAVLSASTVSCLFCSHPFFEHSLISTVSRSRRLKISTFGRLLDTAVTLILCPLPDIIRSFHSSSLKKPQILFASPDSPRGHRTNLFCIPPAGITAVARRLLAGHPLFLPSASTLRCSFCFITSCH